MEEAFLRSEKAHAESMDKMMKTMTTEKAFAILAKNNLTNPSLVEMKKGYKDISASSRKAMQGSMAPAIC